MFHRRCRRSLRSTLLLLAAGTAGGAAACGGEGVIANPLVRVDLTRGWTAKQRWATVSAIPLECQRTVVLDDGAARVRLRVLWRVLDFGKSRRVAAVEVAPDGDGRVPGVRRFAASAVVGQEQGTAVPVQVGWSGEQGCRSVQRNARVLLRADDRSCVAPKQPRLLRPVK